MSGEYNAGFPPRPAVVVPNYGAGVVTDPRMLPAIIANGITYYDSAGTSTSVSTTIPPDHVSVNVTTATDTNILSVTGSGFLYDVISPVGDAGASSLATITIVVDGKTFVIATTAGMSVSQRFFIGADGFSSLGASRLYPKIGKHTQEILAYLLSVGYSASACQPILRFENSLSVFAKMSVVPTASGFNSYAMGRYTLD